MNYREIDAAGVEKGRERLLKMIENYPVILTSEEDELTGRKAYRFFFDSAARVDAFIKEMRRPISLEDALANAGAVK